MPSIKDVAKYCGVSYATVSNVINNKENVSEEIRKKVENAIRVLNFVPNESARSLKKKERDIIGVILPSLEDPFILRFYNGLQEKLSYKSNYSINLYITNEIKSLEREAITRLMKEQASGVILITSMPKDTTLLEAMIKKNIPIVLVNRFVDIEKANFISFNYYEIGIKIAQIVQEKGFSNPFLIPGPLNIQNEYEFFNGFTSVFNHKFNKTNNFKETGYGYSEGFKTGLGLINVINKIHTDIVVCTNYLTSKGVKDAFKINGAFDIPVINIDSEDLSFQGFNELQHLIYRPARKLGLEAGELLINHIKSKKVFTPRRKILQYIEIKDDINFKYINLRRTNNGTLTLYLLDDYSSKAMISLLPDFKKYSKGEIKIEYKLFNYEKLYDNFINLPSYESKNGELPDIIMIDNPWLPDFVNAGLLTSLDPITNETEEIKSRYLEGVYENFCTFNSGIYAIPFNFQVQLLFYRKDLFTDDRIKREFKKNFGIDLKVPETWDEYNAIAEFFTRKINEKSPVIYGNTASGATSTICNFLPRLWFYDGAIFDDNGNITIDSSEGLIALKSYIKSFDFAPENALNLTYIDDVELFKNGKAAMMIMYTAHISSLSDTINSKIAGLFDAAPLPGGISTLSGWSIGVTKFTRNQGLAFDFLRWLLSVRFSIFYTISGGLAPLQKIVEIDEILKSHQFLHLAKEQFKQSRKRTYPFDSLHNFNIKNRDFELIIYKGIREALQKKLPPEDALSKISSELKNKVQ